MRNVLILIRRFSLLLFFLLLQVLSVSMLVKYNRSHRARYMELSYELTGRINRQYADIIAYFNLRENNQALALEISRLRNTMGSNFVSLDNTSRIVADSEIPDSSGLTRKYLWRHAAVINNSVSTQNNMITIERGRNQGIAPEMAVTAAGGIVGLVTDVSDNMAVVMSILHRKSVTSVMLKKSKITGILEWNGASPNILQLRDIPKSTELKRGDTIVTSNISLNYPPGLLVGTIVSFRPEKGGNNYIVNVKPGANFYTLDYVDVIENMRLKEQVDLEKSSKKQQN